jgi:selenocysteine-specific elongation factor
VTERLILGTAGHIDHGKTALIRALSGVDCDRLPEEKLRGITIELGFAPLTLPSGRLLGIVDVPGHERLVRTMVSGAAGVDLVLFAIAADEGMMPQTREHLAICELLGVRAGVVALTKIDAVDAELAELARLEIEEELAGSCLEGAPVVPVSAQTGEGIDALLATLDEVVEKTAPRTLRDGPAWLPVDRVFTMKGFGTVVTGTLRGAPIREGEPMEVFPEQPGDVATSRVRGLQVHGDSVEQAEPGSRCALNLQGLDVAAVPRGSVVATPGRVDYRRRVDVELSLVPQAPTVRSGSRWTVHVGTTERVARLRLFGTEELVPGERALGELRFDTPVVAVEGDRFILRGFARLPGAGWTIGGGRVLDASPHRGRRPVAERVLDLRAMANDDAEAALRARLRRAGPVGLREAELRREVRSIAELPGVQVGADRWIDRDAFDQLVEDCTEAVRQQHEERPFESSVGLAGVRTRLPARVPEDAVRAALDRAVEQGALEARGGGHRLPGHAAHLDDPERAARIAQQLDEAGLAPEAIEALARAHSLDVSALRPVLDYLVHEERLVRVASGLYFSRPAIEDLRERVTQYLQEHTEINPAAYKTLTGQTRKFTVPLMEFFDAEKLTLRRDNVRVLRRA